MGWLRRRTHLTRPMGGGPAVLARLLECLTSTHYRCGVVSHTGTAIRLRYGESRRGGSWLQPGWEQPLQQNFFSPLECSHHRLGVSALDLPARQSPYELLKQQSRSAARWQ
jgi:hypothetical protein